MIIRNSYDNIVLVVDPECSTSHYNDTSLSSKPTVTLTGITDLPALDHILPLNVFEGGILDVDEGRPVYETLYAI